MLGITRFGNWPFFAGESAWMFVRGRHGAAVNRSARLRAYSEARAFLAVDDQLDPRLKTELLARLDHLALNPLENGDDPRSAAGSRPVQRLGPVRQCSGGIGCQTGARPPQGASVVHTVESAGDSLALLAAF